MENFATTGVYRVGSIEVVSLLDGEGALGRIEKLFPDVVEADWEPERGRYPAAFRDDLWRLPFRGYLIRHPGGHILVDTGAGPVPNEFNLDRGGLLGASLAEAGVAPHEIDTVFLTHLHSDHVGGNLVNGAPAFPRARYVTHRAGWDWSTAPDRRDYPPITAQVLPLEPLGVLDLIEGDAEIAPGVRAFETPGHAPGHMSVEVTSGDQRLLILGDVAVHPAQWDHPDWVYVWDDDAEQAVTTRRRVIDAVRGTGALLVCGHWPDVRHA